VYLRLTFPRRPNATEMCFGDNRHAAVSVPAAAQTRTVTGTVTDASTGQPLEGARVAVRGTSLTSTTGVGGQFTIGSVPERSVTITIRRIGSNPFEIVVPSGQNDVRVSLTRDPLRLSDVVVTGQATTVERRNLANAVATVSGEDVSRARLRRWSRRCKGRSWEQRSSRTQVRRAAACKCGCAASHRSTPPRSRLYVVDGVVLSNIAIPSNQNAVTRVDWRVQPRVDPGCAGESHRRPQPQMTSRTSRF